MAPILKLAIFYHLMVICMFEKERYVEPANKALERINTKKIDIFKTIKNSYYFDINFLDENDNGYFPDSQEKDFRGQVQEGLERGNGIFIRLFQLFVDETGSFKDAEEYDDILVFDDTVYYEGYVKECYNDFWGYDEEDFDDDELDDDYDDEDYEDYDDEPEATFFSIESNKDSFYVACTVNEVPPITDFICDLGINICKEEDGYGLRIGYTYLPDDSFHTNVIFEDLMLSGEIDDPLTQALVFLLERNIVFEGEEDSEGKDEDIFENFLQDIKKETSAEIVDVKIKSKSDKFEKEADELLESGEINNYLEHFERLNTTTDSIYNLGEHDVLIILKDGTNLTDWEKVDSNQDILYISEDLSNCNYSPRKYIYSTSLKAAVITGVTNKIKDMESMFENCTSLTDLSGLETWDTSNIEKMEYMFKNCSSLTDLSLLENWDITKANKLWNMFQGCSSLEDISALANWDTSHLTSVASMFSRCSSLEDISALANWDTSHVKNMSGMFGSCSSLEDISALANWDTSHLTSVGGIFSGCSSLVDISALAGWDTSKVSSLGDLVSYCSSLISLSGLENWDTSKVESMLGAFRGCSSLVDISALANWDTSKVETMWVVFENCSSLVDISALAIWDTYKVTGMRYMFSGCSSLKDISSLENWDTSKVTDTIGMFKGCSSLTDLSPLANWNLSRVVDARGMFKGCSSLVDLSSLKDWSFTHICVMKSMFKGCSSLVDVSDLDWEISSMMDTIEIFDDCPNIEAYPSWYEE